MRKYSFIALCAMLSVGIVTAAHAEECVAGVKRTLSWTSSIKGNANQWPDSAKTLGFSVNSSATGCTASKPCVVAYPTNYGNGIDPKYGHVAVLYSCSNNSCMIGDANGICKGKDSPFTKCDKAHIIEFSKAKVIHPR